MSRTRYSFQLLGAIMIAWQVINLAGARVTRNACRAERIDLVVKRGRIGAFGSHVNQCPVVDLSGCLLLPGLINAHDHLEFNLFPRLGRGPYENAVDWASDIYHPESSPVKEHLAVPKFARLLWGGIKNLLSGVTTVAQHNPYETGVFNHYFPVRVIRQFGWAHSLHFSPDMVERFRRTPSEWPFVIHAAEGRDSQAFSEIERLDAIGVLNQRTVLVHAIALKPSDLEILQARKCSIVWCPSSNLFNFGRTMGFQTLASSVPLALGTDSALTGEGDIVDEIRAARGFQPITKERVFEMLTTNAASIFRLPKASGELQEQGAADIVAVVDRGQTPAESLGDFRPDLVITRGRIRLLSQRLLSRNPSLRLLPLQRISIQDHGDWWVDADMSLLNHVTTEALGSGFRLAGKCLSL